MVNSEQAISSETANSQDTITFTNLGGGAEVGRSCHIIQFRGKTVMLDCGLHPAHSGITALPFFDYIDLATVDALVVSHFHLDHAASLPYLTQKTNFKGRVFMTHATKAVIQWMLIDSVRLTNIDNEAELLYDEKDVLACLEKIEAVDFHSTLEAEGIKITPYYAGHILGAAMFMIEIASVKILFTGDYSREEDRHLRAAEIPNEIPDVLITESTFGTMVKTPTKEKEERLTSIIHKTVMKDGRVLMPHFAIGRVQELLLLLDEYWHEHPEIQHIPVYFASALARKCLVLYQAFVYTMNDHFISAFKQRNPFLFRHISNLRNFEKFEDVGPSVVIASNGMLESGPSRRLFEKWCPDSKNYLLLTGYSVEGTMAKHILSMPSEITSLNGQKIPRRMQVEELSFAAHVDFNENCEFIEAVNAPIVILVHGEFTTAQRLKNALQSKLRQAQKNEVKIFNPRNCDPIQLHFKRDKIAQVSGKLALEKVHADKVLGGVLIQKDFQISIFDPEDLREFTGLNTSVIMQCQEVLFSGSYDIIKKQLENIFGSIQDFSKDKDVLDISILNTVIVRSRNPNKLVLEWAGNIINDSIADAVLMIILAYRTSPSALQSKRVAYMNILITGLHEFPNQDILGTNKVDISVQNKNLLRLLENQFGGALTLQDSKITIIFDKNKAEIDINSLEIQCDYEPLKSRVSRVLRRALEVLTPFN